ncbi:MAG: D-alanyl-D-alanine endopeptidase [Ketobacter sp.]
MVYKSLIVLILATLSFFAPTAFSADANIKRNDLNLAAVKASVVELKSGKPLFAKHDDWIAPIASLTKLMTALVVLESGQSLEEWVEIPKPDRETSKNAYSRMRITSQLKRKDLLRIALMSSENLAAYTLAQSYPGGVTAFVIQMNVKAHELGMLDSTFVDASGLSVGNVSTAADMIKLTKAVAAKKIIGEYSTTPVFTARFRKPRYVLGYGNTNSLVHSSRWQVELSKTGYITEAGRCLVMVSKIEGKEVAMVFLDSFGKRTPLGDAGRVKRWIATGNGGKISGLALQYEQDKSKHYPGLKNEKMQAQIK